MTDDEAREALRALLDQRPDLDLKNLSLGLPMNPTYIQQYLTKHVPRRLAPWIARKLAVDLGVDPAVLGVAVAERSHFDLLLFPIRHDAVPECGAEFQIAVRRLIGRTTIICPNCGNAIDLKETHWAIDDLARMAAALDKMAEQNG